MPDSTTEMSNQTTSSSSQDGQANAGQTTTGDQIPLTNRLAEMNRKFTRYQESTDEKLSQLIQLLSTQGSAKSTDRDEGTVESDLDPKAYTDYRFKQAKEELRQESLVEKHKASYQQAMKAFPELDQTSDSYDKAFFNAANNYYNALKASGDPDAPIKSARLAAIDLGKYEQIERERLLADEARRSRALGDGITPPKNFQQSDGGIPDNLKQIAQLLGKDPKKVADYYAKNKERYTRQA